MITKDNLRQIVSKQKDQKLKIDRLVRRDILDEILNSFKDNRVLILTGLRRSGKSTLLREIMEQKKDYCYINFEDEKFLDFKAQDFEMLNEALIEIYGSPKIYFFDEIQNIDKFETFVRRLQDEGKKVIITGSNASLLSKEFGTRLTGRYKTFEIYPFSFKEFIEFNKIKLENDSFYIPESKVALIKIFGEYLAKGGLPEYLKNNDFDYVRTVFENILYKDIISRYSIKRQKPLKELINILATNISSQFTYNSLKNSIGVSNAITVKEYVSYLNNAYLFFELLRFDFSIKKQLNYPKKIYLIDQIFNRFGGLNFSENKGKILENVVFIELKRKNKEIYYFFIKNECDFVIKDRNKITEAIQVCYELNKENKEREIKGLVEAMDKFKLKEGLILTSENEDEIIVENKKIIVKPIWKWLLQ